MSFGKRPKYFFEKLLITNTHYLRNESVLTLENLLLYYTILIINKLNKHSIISSVGAKNVFNEILFMFKLLLEKKYLIKLEKLLLKIKGKFLT